MTEVVDPTTANKLRQYIERIERLEEEKKGVMADIKDIYTEAKSQGFDTKALKQVIKLRGMDKVQRQELEALVDTYAAAVGM